MAICLMWTRWRCCREPPRTLHGLPARRPASLPSVAAGAVVGERRDAVGVVVNSKAKGASLTDASKSAVLRRMIHARWSEAQGEHAILEEVRASVGYGDGATRYADVLIASCWGKGRGLIGIEIKASRSDWLRELRKGPEKRARLEEVCGELFVVAWSGVVKPEELPDGWGLLERRGSVLSTVRAARQRKIESVPVGYVLSIMRNARKGAERAPALDPLALACLRYVGEDITPEAMAALVKAEAEREVSRANERREAAEKRAADAGNWQHQMARLIAHAGGVAYGMTPEQGHDIVAAALTAGGAMTAAQRRAVEQLRMAARIAASAFGEDA